MTKTNEAKTTTTPDGEIIETARPSVPFLYTNEDGDCRCPEHVPAIGGKVWKRDGWKYVSGKQATDDDALCLSCSACGATIDPLFVFAVEVVQDYMGDGVPEGAPTFDWQEFVMNDPMHSVCGRFVVDPIKEYGSAFLDSPFATDWHHEEAAERVEKAAAEIGFDVATADAWFKGCFFAQLVSEDDAAAVVECVTMVAGEDSGGDAPGRPDQRVSYGITVVDKEEGEETFSTDVCFDTFEAFVAAYKAGKLTATRDGLTAEACARSAEAKAMAMALADPDRPPMTAHKAGVERAKIVRVGAPSPSRTRPAPVVPSSLSPAPTPVDDGALRMSDGNRARFGSLAHVEDLDTTIARITALRDAAPKGSDWRKNLGAYLKATKAQRTAAARVNPHENLSEPKPRPGRAVLRFVRKVVGRENFGRQTHCETIQAAIDDGLVVENEPFKGLYPYTATAAGRVAVGLPADKGAI